MVLVVGASGATGHKLVLSLLEKGEHVRVIVRNRITFHQKVSDRPELEVIEASILDLNPEELDELVKDCSGIASCLGHNISFKGVYGQPRMLVSEATRLLCEAALRAHTSEPIRFVLMNTDGNLNPDLKEPASGFDRAVLGLLKVVLPPHKDNLAAAEYLREHIGKGHDTLRWVAVRPGNLFEEDRATAYTIYEGLQASPLTGGFKTSRINVADFMADLLTNNKVFLEWEGQMPCVYNAV